MKVNHRVVGAELWHKFINFNNFIKNCDCVSKEYCCDKENRDTKLKNSDNL
jgi:hypothetical protein